MQYEPAIYERSDDRVGEDIEQELEQARRTIRLLERELRKARQRIDEIGRAYQLTVANLVQTSGTCAILEHERDAWRRRAEGRSADPALNIGALELQPSEVAAIRKAVARLHHPDAGGDVERMKQWNTALDALEVTPSARTNERSTQRRKGAKD